MANLLMPTKPSSIYFGDTMVNSVWFGNTKVWSGWDPTAHQRVGGRIFYVHNDSGNTYTFYDVNGNILPTQTVAGLADAYYYDKSGSGSDMFYVYDNTSELFLDASWGTSNITTGVTANTIGSGKTNTATILSTYSSSMGTMWTWLRDTINANSVGGCNDWFIGSKAEQDQLNASGLVDWYSSHFIWSSVELYSYSVYLWHFNHAGNEWNGAGKQDPGDCFAMRAF